MAKQLQVQLVGAPLKRGVEAASLSDLRNTLGVEGETSAVVNNQPVTENYELSDGDFVVFTQNIKGNQSWDVRDAEEAKGNCEAIFGSPTLAIVKLASGHYRVNGQKVTAKQLNELFVVLGAGLLKSDSFKL